MICKEGGKQLSEIPCRVILHKHTMLCLLLLH